MATKHIITVWPAGLHPHPRRFVNKYRPDLYHPELHLVRFSATVEPMADNGPPSHPQPGDTVRHERGTNEGGPLCAPEAQQHPDNPDPNREPVGRVASLRSTRSGATPCESTQAVVSDVPGRSRPAAAAAQEAHRQGVAVSRRTRTKKLIQHGVPRDAALRFEALTQGWIERITG